MKLLFSGSEIGTIANIEGEGFWMHGQFTPHRGINPELAEFFRFMTSPDSFSQDPSFSEKLLNEENWELLDDDGRKRGIALPAVQTDGLISWRWRDLRGTSNTKRTPKRKQPKDSS